MVARTAFRSPPKLSVLASRPMSLSRGLCAYNTVYSVFKVSAKNRKKCPSLIAGKRAVLALFLPVNRKFLFDFLDCLRNRRGNPALAHVFRVRNLLLGQAPNAVHPQAAELFLRKLALDADHRFGGIAFLGLLFEPLLDNDLRPISGTCRFVQRHCMFVLRMITLFLVVIVFVGP